MDVNEKSRCSGFGGLKKRQLDPKGSFLLLEQGTVLQGRGHRRQ